MYVTELFISRLSTAVKPGAGDAKGLATRPRDSSNKTIRKTVKIMLGKIIHQEGFDSKAATVNTCAFGKSQRVWLQWQEHSLLQWWAEISVNI